MFLLVSIVFRKFQRRFRGPQGELQRDFRDSEGFNGFSRGLRLLQGNSRVFLSISWGFKWFFESISGAFKGTL